MSIDSLLTEWRHWQNAQSLSARTIDDREAVVRHFLVLTGCNAVHFTPADVVEYTGRSTLSAASRATYHATLRAYAGWLIRTGKRMDDPTFNTLRPKRPKNLPRPITDQQLDLLLMVANRQRTRMMIVLAAYQGLRIHEIAKFRGSDIDYFSKSVTVTGKGGKTAVIALHPAVEAESRAFPRNGYWFPSYPPATRPHVTAHSVAFTIKRTMRRAGFNATPHQIRHWYGTSLLAAGIDVMIVKDLMRHESVATTQIYTKITLRQQQAGIVVLPTPEQLRPAHDLPNAA